MDLIDYVRMIRRRWVWISVFALLGTAAGVLSALLTPPTYQSTAQMFVSNPVVSQTAAQFTLARMPTYASLLSTKQVSDRVQRRLGLGLSFDELERRVTVEVPQDTVILLLTARDDDAEGAADLANAAADGLTRAITQLETTPRNGSPVVVRITRPALAPLGPVGPDRLLRGLVGLVAGLAVGLLTAAVRDQTSPARAAANAAGADGPGDTDQERSAFSVGHPTPAGERPDDERVARAPLASSSSAPTGQVGEPDAGTLSGAATSRPVDGGVGGARY